MHCRALYLEDDALRLLRFAVRDPSRTTWSPRTLFGEDLVDRDSSTRIPLAIRVQVELSRAPAAETHCQWSLATPARAPAVNQSSPR